MLEDKKSNKIFIAFAAFTLSNGIIINFFGSNGMETFGAMISSYSLLIITILSAFKVLLDSYYRKTSIALITILLLLVVYEKYVDAFGTVKEYASDFFIHGVGGFLIGMAIGDIIRFLKYLSLISFCYLLVFITEPMNHALIHLNEMATGYLMVGLIINVILAYFTVYRNNTIFLSLAIVSSLITTLFTARGCGLTLLCAWSVFYIWNKLRMGKRVYSTLWGYIIIALIGYIVFYFVIEQILGSGVNYDTGSFLEKLASGYADSSNGRDEVWEIGMSMATQSSWTGLGFGADRTVAESFFVHNIFLELFIDFGLPIFLLIVVSYFHTTIKGIIKSPYSLMSGLIVAQLIKTWVQLLFSSSYLNTMLPLMFIIGLSVKSILDSKKIVYE